MTKRLLLPFLWLLVICTSIVFGGIADDGVIEDGEYDYGVIEILDKNLLVTGGGAYSIDAYGKSYIEILNTSPLSSSGGIADLNLGHTSHLKILGGEMGIVDFRGDSTGDFYGGSINYIRSFQNSDVLKHITFICDVQSVSYNESTHLLAGNWLDGSGFSITLLDQSGYDSVYSNIHFIPEPATLALLGLGTLLLRKRKR